MPVKPDLYVLIVRDIEDHLPFQRPASTLAKATYARSSMSEIIISACRALASGLSRAKLLSPQSRLPNRSKVASPPITLVR